MGNGYNNGLDASGLLDQITKITNEAVDILREGGEEAGEEFVAGTLSAIKKHSKEAKSEITKIFEDFNKTTNGFKSRKSVTQAEWTRVLGLSKELMKSERYADSVREKLSDISVVLKSGMKVSGLEKVLEEWSKVGGLVESVQWAEAGKNYRKKPSTKKPKVETPVVQADPAPKVKKEAKQVEDLEQRYRSLIQAMQEWKKLSEDVKSIKQVKNASDLRKQVLNLVSQISSDTAHIIGPGFGDAFARGFKNIPTKDILAQIGWIDNADIMGGVTEQLNALTNIDLKNFNLSDILSLHDKNRTSTTWQFREFYDILNKIAQLQGQMDSPIKETTEALHEQASAAKSAADAQKNLNEQIMKYVPKGKKGAVQDAYKDDDGYWITLKDGWEASNTDSGARTIHSDTVSDLRYQISGIKKNNESIIKEYNSLMEDMAREHLTIGTSYSEGTDKWNLRDMVSEAQYQADFLKETMDDTFDDEERAKAEADIKELEAFVKKYKKYIDGIHSTENHNSSFDNTLEVETDTIKEVTQAKEKEADVTERATQALHEQEAATESAAQAQEKLNVQMQEAKNIGYHAGDLGKAESYGHFAYGKRDTGHFGTGTYFVGNQKAIEKYNWRDGKPAPIETVDFGKYHLFKPEDTEQAYELHAALKQINDDLLHMHQYDDVDLDFLRDAIDNGNLEPISQFLGKYLTDEARSHYENEALEYKSYLDSANRDSVRKEIESSYDEINKDFGDSIDDLYLIDDELLDQEVQWRLDEIKAQRENFNLDEEIAKRVAYDIEHGKFESISEMQGLKDNLVDRLAKIFVNSSREELSDALEETFRTISQYPEGSFYKVDNASTVFMKQFGYEGIDTRHTDLDNSAFGSVIYDLKDEDLARRQEILRVEKQITEEKQEQKDAIKSTPNNLDDKQIEAARLEAEQFVATCKEVINQEIFDDIDCSKLLSDLETAYAKLMQLKEEGKVVFGADDPENLFYGATHVLEYQKRVAEAAKDGIVYHAGVLGNVERTMKSRPLGSVVPVKSGEGNSLTGLYTTPDWDGFVGNEWSGAPISTIDINQYKLFDARRKSVALQAHAFFDNLNGTIYGYQEYFDYETQEMAKTTDVKSIESLYAEFKNVFVNAEMSFEQFAAFIKESAAIVKGHDFKPIDYVDIDEGVGKSYSTSALQGVSKEIFNSDSFSTRLMKMLGYEGLDTRGSGFDSTYRGGTVIFDVKPESIISTDGKWSELMSRHGVEIDEKSLEREEKRRQLAFDTAKAYSQQADAVTNISSADAKAKLTAIQRQAYNYRRPTDNDKALAERESTLTEKLSEIESIKKEFPELEKACISAEKAVSKTLDTLHRVNVDTNDESVSNELKDTFDIIQHGESVTAKFETTANTVHEALRKMRDALPEDRQAWGTYIDKMLASGDDRAIDTFKSMSGSIGDHSELYKMDNLGDGRVAVTFSGMYDKLIEGENKYQQELEETGRIAETRTKELNTFMTSELIGIANDMLPDEDKTSLISDFSNKIMSGAITANEALNELYHTLERIADQRVDNDFIDDFGLDSEQVVETVSQLQKLSSVDVTRIFDSVDLKAFLEMFNIDKSNFATFRTLFEELMQITKAMSDGVDVGNAFDMKMAEITDTVMRLGGHMVDLDDGGYATMVQDFYKHMSNTKIQFNDTIKAEYTKDQWKSLYGTYKNRLTADVTKGIPVDSLYQELNDEWPGLFPESENQQADFKLIIEKLDEARKLQANNWKVLQGFVSSDRDSIQGSVDDLYEKMSDALFVSKEIEATKVESDVDKNLDSIKQATEEQSDDLEQQIAAAEQAKENLDKAFQNVKSASSRAVLKGQTKEDFEDFARQIANDSGMELGTVAVSRDEMNQMRLATIKLINKELAQSITYTYDVQEVAQGVNEAFLRSSYAIGDANKALENARKKEEQDAKKRLQNDTWLYAQRGKLDTQQRRYTDPDRGVDGKLSIMSTETSLADDAEHTIESLANHIKESIKKSLSDGLTDEVRRNIINDLEILENEIKVRQQELYSSTTMKSSQYETNKQAYEQYMRAFTARAQKSGVFSQMEDAIFNLNFELANVGDAKSMSQFVDNFKVARNKLQAEIAEFSRDTKHLQAQMSILSSEAKHYNNIQASVRSIGEDNFGDSFKQKLENYESNVKNAVDALDNLYKANGTDDEDNMHIAFNDAALQLKNSRVEIEGILKQSQKLDQVMANMDAFGSKNLDPSELKNLQQAMLSFASSVEDGVFKFKGFNKAGTEMYGTLEQSSGEIKNVTVALKQSSDQLFMYGTNANRADNEWEEFKNTLASGTKNLVGMYVGFQEGVQAIRSGVEAVKQIDLAMTELKKVTDETDDSYREFLEDAGRTSAVIGSTVSDFAEASATFARLGYSLDEASSMAETAIVYKNVADGLDTVEEASDSIISTMMAFGIEASDTMGIIDRFNAVGKIYADYKVA